jgi:hypothetical protein
MAAAPESPKMINSTAAVAVEAVADYDRLDKKIHSSYRAMTISPIDSDKSVGQIVV